MTSTGKDDVAAIVQAEIEKYLLGARTFDRDRLLEIADVPIEVAREQWVAMGFPVPPDPAALTYTESDADALRTMSALVADGVVDGDMPVRIARTVGHSMARLAEWQIDILNALILREIEDLELDSPDSMPSAQQLTAITQQVAERTIPSLESLMVFAWRRHLAAAMSRSLAAAESGALDEELRTLVVGFADMVGYTRLTRHLDRTELTDLIEEFVSNTTFLITSAGGWVIKNLGDEVMFAFEDPQAAANLALELQEVTKVSDVTPELRIGMASGRVLQRLGDLYGPVVNTAARLTGVARPGTVLIDDRLADLLESDPNYSFRHLREVRVRGIDRLGLHVLRRSRKESPVQ
ncbi:adenylate/guanylate cyclase domain-containing protein [Aldersonia kunmingensis]|uniref:adenylate/guanylate cyclase domain-containing protein n=1 Tax=Aldersonia kunmingensis TaxID=408066 RepID=UPI00083326C5|nr:adenylate/guanylate cyclase domain-containing protein [Aldersonia kunmingensis]